MILFIRCFCRTQSTASVVFLCFGLQGWVVFLVFLCFFQCNVLVKTCDRINVRIGIRTLELKIQIIKHSRRPGIMPKYCFQRPRSRNKSVFHDVYIRPKGTELSHVGTPTELWWEPIMVE